MGVDCYVALLGERLVATSVLVPHFPIAENRLQLIYDTDLFVDPDCTDRHVLMKFLFFRDEQLKKKYSTVEPSPAFFAIANQPKLFPTVTKKIVDSGLGPTWAIGLGKSNLTEFDLSKHEKLGCENIRLNEMSSDESGTLRETSLPFGRWRSTHKQALLKSSERCWEFSDLTGVVTGRLCDFRKVRKIRLTTKGARYFSTAVPDQEVKYLAVSFDPTPKGSLGGPLGSAVEIQTIASVESILNHARRNHFDFVTFRDLPERVLHEMKSKGARFLSSERSMFAWGYQQSESARDTLLRLKAEGASFEALFL